jgi:hypothetical protein
MLDLATVSRCASGSANPRSDTFRRVTIHTILSRPRIAGLRFFCCMTVARASYDSDLEPSDGHARTA